MIDLLDIYKNQCWKLICKKTKNKQTIFSSNMLPSSARGKRYKKGEDENPG